MNTLSPTLWSAGKNQKSPRGGQVGYITPAVGGVPEALKRRIRAEVAKKWVDRPHQNCRIAGPQHFRAGNKIRSGPEVGKLATSPLPFGVSQKLRSGGQNSEWPTSRHAIGQRSVR